MRRHTEKNVVDKRIKLNAQFGGPIEYRKFRKRHPFDCGKPKCIMCHGEKIFGIQRKCDIVSKNKMDDMLKDV